jgi:hypothetical protein
MDPARKDDSAALAAIEKELEKTWRERKKAIAEFDCLVDQAPSKIPEPDGSLRIQQARAKMSEAINAHSRAVKRYMELFTKRSIALGKDRALY